MKNLTNYILKTIASELIAILIFGFAYFVASLLPADEISSKIKWGILFLYGISAISLPFIIKHFSK